MKVKLGGLGGIKMLLLAHGEKLGIAIVGALALLLVYKSLIGRERLPENLQADNLREQIQLARAGVENSSWDKAPPEEIRTEIPLAQTGERMVDVEDYRGDAWRIGWNAPLVPPTVLRTDPVLLEAQDVEAYGSSGLLAFADEDIRRTRALEEAAKQGRREQKQDQMQEEMQREQERGRRGGRRGREDPYGVGVDPEHPNRRPVSGPVGSTGIPTQGDEQIVTAYWATVVAKVPIKDQIRAFKDVFENARGYNEGADFPSYVGYYVERAEVSPGEELAWTSVRVYNGKGNEIGPVVSHKVLHGEFENDGKEKKPGVTTDWATNYPEVVDPNYLDPSGILAFPLPPLVGRDFGYDLVATHSEIPLAADAVELEEEEQPAADAAQPAEGEEARDVFAGATSDVNQRFGPGAPRSPYAARGGYPSRGGYDAEMGGMGGYPRGGGREGYGSEMDGGYQGYGRSFRGAMGPGMMPRVDNWLLRFFDFSVEPGKKYKYRVLLVMQDPNCDAIKQTLDSKVIDRLKTEKMPYRVTEASKPSRTVSIPLAGTVRVASADAARERSSTSEPDVTLLVESFDADEKGRAIQAAIEADFRRGSVANMTEDAEIIVEQGRAIDKEKDFKFRTGITVVDIRGGKRMAGGAETEARALLMDPAGQLFVQRESDDSDAVERHRAIFAEPDKNNPYGAGERGYQGPRGMERMEFRGR